MNKLKLTDNSNSDKFKNLETKVQTLLAEGNELKSHDTAKNRKRISEITNEVDMLLMDMRKIAGLMEKKYEKITFWLTFSSFVSLVAALILQNLKPTESFAHINLEYYSLVVGLVPVLLIALYFSDKKSITINSNLTAWTELLGRIIPSILAIAASLYAVAFSQSNSVTFYISVYGPFTLTIMLVLAILMSRTQKK